MLTTHYMADVEALCERVIVIHHGAILFDGALRELAARFAGHKTLVVTLESPADLTPYGDVVDATPTRATLRLARDDTPAVVAAILSNHAVRDLTVEDPPIDDVIELAFASAETSG